VGHDGKAVTFSLYLIIPPEEAARFKATASLVFAGFRNQLLVAALAPNHAKLGKAVQELGQKGWSEAGAKPGSFPPAAFPRKGLPVALEPANRVSWMAGLLPYLGHKNLYNYIDFNQSWKDPRNWLAAQTLVPEFLDPTYPAHLQWVSYPGLPFDAAATHVVGIAGVGPEAAYLTDDDEKAQGKLGAFGFNRNLALQAIINGRGLSNTAIMIQLPPDSEAGMAPWIAGGGSTVRSIPESEPGKKSIDPFVGQHGNKKGTFVVMGDGSIKFVSSDISDKVLQDMCTIGPKSAEFEEGLKKYIVSDAPPAPVAPPPEAKPEPKPPVPDKPAPPPSKPGIPAGWKMLSNAEYGISAAFPGDPQVKKLALPPELGGEVTQILLEKQQEKMKFIISCQSLPPGAAVDPKFQKEIDMILQTAPGAKIKGQKDISMGSYAGREINIEIPGGGELIMKVCIAENRVLLQGFNAANINAAGADMQAFFGSLTIQKK
jgi:hypothetical protein